MKRLLSGCLTLVLSLVMSLSACTGAVAAPAYRENVTTPHWEWVDRHAGGTVRALFITSFLGKREPEELAQRFDIDIDVVPIKANPSGIPTEYDTEYPATALADSPDVIVVSYRGAWPELSDVAKQGVIDAVAGGTPLIALSAGSAP